MKADARDSVVRNEAVDRHERYGHCFVGFDLRLKHCSSYTMTRWVEAIQPQFDAALVCAHGSGYRDDRGLNSSSVDTQNRPLMDT